MEDVNSLAYKIEENLEKREVWISTPKRKEKIKVFVPWNGFANWKITYENGKHPPGLSGSYQSRKQAVQEVLKFLERTKPSKTVLHDEWFGPDQKKQVKRKQVRATRIKTDDS